MESVCSICSKPSSRSDGSNFEIVDEVTRDLVEVLAIEIKTTSSSDPLMCYGCKNELLDCFDFKAKCIYTEDLMYPYIDAGNDGSKIDIGTIYLKSTGINKRLANPGNLKICRLCLERVDGHFYHISGDTLKKYNVDELFFQKFLPELNLNVTEAPIMCEDCLTCLRRFAKLTCLPMAKEVSLSNTKNKENKRTASSLRTNKSNICKYCKQKKTNIRRHIESMHKNEAEVREFMLMGDDDPKKLERLAQIRRDGNFIAFKVDRKIVPSRLALRNSDLNEAKYIACSECKQILKKSSLSKHLKNSCTKNYSKSAKGMLQRSKAISENIHVRANDIVRQFLFPVFREGPVKEAIRFEELIILYANELTSKYSSPHHFPMIRNKMIRMAKVLLKIKSLDESVQTFKDILKPHMFDNLMKVINSMGEYNELTGNYEKPTLPTEIGTSLKYMTKLFINESIKNNDIEEKSLAVSFLHLLQTSLPYHVNKTMSEGLLKQKKGNVVGLPSMDDVTKLITYVVTQRNKYFSKLNMHFDSDSWINLLNYTLISVIIINDKRRPGEIESSLVSNLDRLTNISEECELFKQLSSSGQACIREYVRFGIGGGANVVMDKSMNQCLKLLMKYRKDAGVLDNNPYIFALPQEKQECDEKINFRHLHATPLLVQYSNACGAINPKTLGAKILGKQVTSNNETNLRVQCYLTHSEKIQDYYSMSTSECDSSDEKLNMDEDIRPKSTHKRRRLLVAAGRHGRSVANRTWTIPEREATRKMFAHYITKKNLPTNLEISNALKNCPVLKNLTVSHIKHWIYSGKKSLMSNLDPANRKKGTKRRNKPNVCKYCKEQKTNIKRHIESLHKNEAEVKEFMLMRNGDPKKLELLAQIRRDGNFVAFKCNRDIVPSSASKNRHFNKLGYLACPKCKQILKKISLRKHLKKSCKKNYSKSVNGMLQRSKAISESIHVQANDIVREFLFSALREGPVKETIRFDELIILYANELSAKYKSQHNFPMIRNKMIRMAKMLLKIKSLDESVQTFKDILKPQMFDNLMKVIKCMGEYNEVTGNYGKPTFPTEVGISLKYITKLFISDCIKNNNIEEKLLAENLLHLLQTSLPDHGKTAKESLLKQKTEKIVVVLPSLDDVKKLICYVVTQREKYFNKLNGNFDLDSWINLSNYTLISTLIFNRTMPGELERSLISDLDKSTNISEECEHFKELSTPGKSCVRGYVWFRHKGGFNVLLDRSMKECLNLLMKYRKNAGVEKNNPYIFALPQDGQECDGKIIFRHLHVTPLMKQYSEACGASNPKTLTATTLRQQVATESMKLNSLQVYLTHSGIVEEEYYRHNEQDETFNFIRISLATQGIIPFHAITAAARRNQNTDLPAPSSSGTSTSPAVTPGSSVAKKTWTVQEKQIARKVFGQCIAQNILPEDWQISIAIRFYPELRHRTVPQVKSWIHNSMKAQPEFRAALNLKPGGRTPWSEEQATLVKRYFKENITLKKAPKKEECMHLIQEYPEVLHNKDWVRVKTFVYNIYRNK